MWELSSLSALPFAASVADNGIRVGLISSETYRTGTVLVGVVGKRKTGEKCTVDLDLGSTSAKAIDCFPEHSQGSQVLVAAGRIELPRPGYEPGWRPSPRRSGKTRQSEHAFAEAWRVC